MTAKEKMTSRERVLTAFEHQEPDRVPIWCGASVEFWEKSKNELALDDEALAYGREYAILGGDWSPFWHDAIDLLGMEELYLKMYSEPELIDAVMKHLVDYYAEVSRRIYRRCQSRYNSRRDTA